jgi:MurNAc alpha-1-phosphate uridylyltransferase
MKVAMILAAGRGKRLQPYTNTCPKPLLHLKGQPLIEYHLQKLSDAGFEKVVVNCAWLAEQFEPSLGDGSRWGLKIVYSYEPEGGLETAGGIIRARNHLGDAPFALINGDVFSEFDYQVLADKVVTLASDVNGHLILVPTPDFKEQGDFGLQNHRVLDKGEWTFSGLSVLTPQIFDGMEEGFLPLAPILREQMLQGSISGEVFEGYWSDIGTIDRLNATEEYLD